MRPEYYVICAVLVLFGYFWGKIINKYFPILHKVNTTALGVFIVFGLFQIVTFLGVPNNWNVEIYRYALIVFLVVGPVLCLCLWVNVLPHWNDLFALIFSVAVTAGICYLSSTMNTNNLYFDSTFYLSRVIDSSTANTMAHLSSYNGSPLLHIYSLYDYQGFYYFWGIILRQYNLLFPVSESLTPMYLWTATMVYGMILGNTIAMSIQLVCSKLTWKNFAFGILAVAILSPYYVNYFNTTLAFFGNAYRTLAVGLAVLLVYAYFKEKENRYFILLGLIYLAGLSCSSSCFFIFIFLTVACFFGLITMKKIPQKTIFSFLCSNIPLLIYFYIMITDWYVISEMSHPEYFCIGYVVILIASFFFEKLSVKALKISKISVMVLYALLLFGMIFLSFNLKDGEYGYEFFFEPRSANDMTLNYVSWIDWQELLRNIILWILLAFGIFTLKRNRAFKITLIIAILLFINPLVSPFNAKYATQVVYCRVFDILVNPFTIVFFTSEFLRFMKPQWLAIVCASIMGCYDCYCAYQTITIPFSPMLVKNEEGYNWKTKVTDSQWDMYNYILNNIPRSYDNRPLFLSQDVFIKSYIPDIQLYISPVNIRSTTNDDDFDPNDSLNRAIVYFNPLAVTADDSYNGYKPDYTQIRDVILSTDAQYVLMRYPMAVLDPKGWYVEAYKYAEDICTEVYKNDSWILLKVEK